MFYVPDALWMKFSKEEIISIVNDSNSVSDLIRKLGYNTLSGGTRKQVNKMLDYYNLTLPIFNHKIKDIDEERVCAICGNTFTIHSSLQNVRKYCFECSPSTNNPTYKIKAMKTKVVSMKGGKCEKCGYDKCVDALELHHTDPSTKDYDLANTGAAPSFEKYLEEANKCILLCANCHREEHWRLRQGS